LDEFTEWPRPARESLRHVMERHVLDLHRAEGAFRWHANPWIVAATNPCRCGKEAARCVCPGHERHAYRRKLSAPLLERFPIQVEVGDDTSQPSRTWQESRDWVAAVRRDRTSGGTLPWTADAESEAQTLSQGNTCSRRVSRAVQRLAEGHARWNNRAEIHDVDVRAAWDVTWMARGGWWQD
jgi:predicted ATPase with chaperone activity